MRVSTVGAFGAALALAAAMSVVPLQVAGAQSPSTSVLVPSSGATLSGSTYFDASAPNATSVGFVLFGGSYGYNGQLLCAATLTYYGWVCSWNTATVPDGTYLLVSVASGPSGIAFSSGVRITVNNPSTTVIIPASGATLDTSQGYVLDAVTSPGATAVSFVLAGTTLTATPTIYGWIYDLPPTPPCGGSVQPPALCDTISNPSSLQSVATYPGGVSATSPSINVTLIFYVLEVGP